MRAAVVPISCHEYIPLAERYGIGDDGYRSSIVESLSREQRGRLVAFLQSAPQELFTWLEGPEAHAVSPTPEYVAFTCLTMAAEYAKAIDEHSS
jgi:hypothetical protein